MPCVFTFTGIVTGLPFVSWTVTVAARHGALSSLSPRTRLMFTVSVALTGAAVDQNRSTFAAVAADIFFVESPASFLAAFAESLLGLAWAAAAEPDRAASSSATATGRIGERYVMRVLARCRATSTLRSPPRVHRMRARGR